MRNEIVQVTTAAVPKETRRQADTDERLIELWVHGRSPATIRAYRADAKGLLTFTETLLSEVTLGDLQSFADSLDGRLAPASKHRCLSAVKSLFAFATR